MNKRWYKVSELVDAREVTKFEIIEAALNGKIPVYNPEGMELIRVKIPYEEDKNNTWITAQFLMDIDVKKKIPERLYNSYEDLKDCLIKDSDRLTISFSFLGKEVDAKTFKSEYFINLAKEKLANYNMSGDKLNSAIIQENEDLNPRARNTLYKIFIGLDKLGIINLRESGLAQTIEEATKEANCRVPKSTVSKVIADISQYQNQINS